MASSVLSVLGYAPEIYSLSNSIIYKKPYNEYNSMIIWMIWITSSLLGVTYSYFIKDYYIMASYSTSAALNITVCTLRYYNFRPKKDYNQINNTNHNSNYQILSDENLV